VVSIRVTVDHDRCCGIGNCAMTVPEVFDQSDRDGRVILLQASPPDEYHDLVRRASGMCPCEAITVDQR
jgi:ferredoxin